MPLRLASGVLDKVTARIPFPNLWSAPLTLSLDTLTLDFEIVALPTASPKGKAPEYPFRSDTHRTRRTPLSPSVDLAASVTSAADEFLHEELDAYEEAELDQSIRQSLILSKSDPFVQSGVPGAFPSGSGGSSSGGHDGGGEEPLPANVESTTVLAGLVERILARLECTVNNIRIRLHHHGKVLELRVRQIGYADDTASTEQQPGVAIGATSRTVRISDVGIYLIPAFSHPASATTRSRPSFTATSRTSSMSSASTESGGNSGEMYMSQAVADLRQSVMSDVGSEASVYESAMSDVLRPEQSDTVESDKGDGGDGSRASTPRGGPSTPPVDHGIMLLSLGSEDVVVRLKTSKSASQDVAQSNTHVRHSNNESGPNSASVIGMPAISLQVTVGTVAVLLLPSHMATLLAMTRPFGRSSPTPVTTSSADGIQTSQPKMDAQIRVRSIVVSAVYDMAVEANTSPHESGFDSYWSRPTSVYIPVGHLKLKLDSLEASYSNPGQTYTQGNTVAKPLRPAARRASTTRFGPKPAVVALRLQDVSLFEYIATHTTPPTAGIEADDTIPGGAYPILLFDGGLPKQYDAEHGSRTYGPSGNTFPEFDQVDWRNSGLQKKSGGGEKLWKVRPKNKSAMKAPLQGETDSAPVMSVRKEMTSTSGKSYPGTDPAER